MKRRLLSFVMTLAFVPVILSGCRKEKNVEEDTDQSGESKMIVEKRISDNQETVNEKNRKVKLKFWCDENEIEMFQERAGKFTDKYKNEEKIEVLCKPIGASVCKDTFLADLDNGADVFCIPDDQILTMAASGVLEEVENSKEIAKRNLEGAVEAASIDGKLYAYPLTADNGYFLYYDKRYFDKKDVRTLDQILDICAENHKKFVMSWTSGWYLYSFFGNTGLHMGINEDGLTNYCDWNAAEGEVTGVDIAQALLNIAGHPGFQALEDSEFVAAAKKGTAIAVVSGVWDAAALEEAFGGEYGACRLPTYTCAGKQVQMASFQGYRLLGVNSYSKHREWAEKLADYLSDEESQKFYFEYGQHGPSNSSAAVSDIVMKNPAISAVLAQSEYAVRQQVGQKYWIPVTEFGSIMAKGNPDHILLQDLMDQMVAGITE